MWVPESSTSFFINTFHPHWWAMSTWSNDVFIPWADHFNKTYCVISIYTLVLLGQTQSQSYLMRMATECVSPYTNLFVFLSRKMLRYGHHFNIIFNGALTIDDCDLPGKSSVIVNQTYPNKVPGLQWKLSHCCVLWIPYNCVFCTTFVQVYGIIMWPLLTCLGVG